MDPECDLPDETNRDMSSGTSSGVPSTEKSTSASTDEAPAAQTTTTTTMNQSIGDDDKAIAAPDNAKKRRRLSATPFGMEEGGAEQVVDAVSAKRRVPSDHWDHSRLLSLSDEVLLDILKYLDSISLDRLGQTCLRFNALVADRFLWGKFDFSGQPMSASEILQRFFYLTDKTHTFNVSGLRSLYPSRKWKNTTITRNLLDRLVAKCPQLVRMSVEEANIDVNEYSIRNFPPRLTSLVLRHCEAISIAGPFLNKVDTHLPDLAELRLEHCSWFETHQLIVLSKLPNLRLLSLRGCRSLMNCVPYGSVATRFGFQKLHTLDVRDTPISDSDIQCFNITKTLRTLLMECPAVTPIASVSHVDSLAGCSSNTCPRARSNSLSSTSTSSSSSPSPSPPPVNYFPRIDIEPYAVQAGNHIINVVVNQRNYVDINNGAAADDNDMDNPRGVPGLNNRPELAQHQLIIVRGLENNENLHDAARRNRISWQVVNDPQMMNQFGIFNSSLQQRFAPVNNITDRGICSFGQARNNPQANVVWIRAEARNPDTLLERLEVRGYRGVTDTALLHLAECSPNLIHLDVTGTSVTAQGVRNFSALKPNCRVVSNVREERKESGGDGYQKD